MVRRIVWVIAGAIAAVGLLAVASWFTTREDWDSGYTAGVIRVQIRGPDGRPFPGAMVTVRNPDTGEESTGYPFLESRPVADAAGRLTLTQPRQGIQFGGLRWRLFWTIPMGAQEPRFVCEVTAPGFRPARVRIRDLFLQPTKEQVVVAWPSPEDQDKLTVYEVHISLSR